MLQYNLMWNVTHFAFIQCKGHYFLSVKGTTLTDAPFIFRLY
jgi:hypothetical protein